MNSYAPSSAPSPTACSRSASGAPPTAASRLTTERRPARARLAAPAARRTASGLYAPAASGAPRPATATTGNGPCPKDGSRVTSSSAPRAPRSARAGSSRPPSSRSTASAPGVGRSPSGPLPTATTTASPVSFSSGWSVAEIVGGTLDRGVPTGARGPERSASVPPVSPLTSPLHDRHVAPVPSSPTSVVGRCRSSTRVVACSRSTPPSGRPWACSTSPTWGRRRCGGRALRRSSTAASPTTSSPHRPWSGSVHALLRRERRRWSTT